MGCKDAETLPTGVDGPTTKQQLTHVKLQARLIATNSRLPIAKNMKTRAGDNLERRGREMLVCRKEIRTCESATETNSKALVIIHTNAEGVLMASHIGRTSRDRNLEIHRCLGDPLPTDVVTGPIQAAQKTCCSNVHQQLHVKA